MTRSEIAMLLGAIAGRDQRTVGDADVLAWHEDLDDIDYQDAREAVKKHFRESTERVMPAHIRRLVKQIRSERSRGASEALALPGKLEDDPARARRMSGGMAACREVVAQLRARLESRRAPDDAEQTPSDRIRSAALERAAADRRGRRT